jgi:purine nucleosidase
MSRIPLVIDCDPGIDDALALMLAAASPEFDWLGVTCVAGNRPLAITTDNASRILAVAGRGDVPVFAGSARPIAYAEARCNLVHGADGLGGAVLPAGRPPDPQHAVDFLVGLLESRPPDTVTLVAIGPLTNLALAELHRPGLLRRTKAVLVMGGAAFVPGNISPAAEFNFYADAVAAHVVCSAGARLTLFGLDVTGQAHMPPDWIDAFALLPSESGRAAHHMLQAYAALDPLLHDACPVAYLLRPEAFRGALCGVAIDWQPGPDEGRLLATPAGAAPPSSPTGALVMTDVDTALLLDLVRQRITLLP